MKIYPNKRLLITRYIRGSTDNMRIVGSTIFTLNIKNTIPLQSYIIGIAKITNNYDNLYTK